MLRAMKDMVTPESGPGGVKPLILLGQRGDGDGDGDEEGVVNSRMTRSQRAFNEGNRGIVSVIRPVEEQLCE